MLRQQPQHPSYIQSAHIQAQSEERSSRFTPVTKHMFEQMTPEERYSYLEDYWEANNKHPSEKEKLLKMTMSQANTYK